MIEQVNSFVLAVGSDCNHFGEEIRTFGQGQVKEGAKGIRTGTAHE